MVEKLFFLVGPKSKKTKRDENFLSKKESPCCCRTLFFLWFISFWLEDLNLKLHVIVLRDKMISGHISLSLCEEENEKFELVLLLKCSIHVFLSWCLTHLISMKSTLEFLACCFGNKKNEKFDKEENHRERGGRNVLPSSLSEVVVGGMWCCSCTTGHSRQLERTRCDRRSIWLWLVGGVLDVDTTQAHTHVLHKCEILLPTDGHQCTRWQHSGCRWSCHPTSGLGLVGLG